MATRRVALLFQQHFSKSRISLSISKHNHQYNIHSNFFKHSRLQFSSQIKEKQDDDEEEDNDEYESDEYEYEEEEERELEDDDENRITQSQTQNEDEDQQDIDDNEQLETDEEDLEEEEEEDEEFVYGEDSDDEFTKDLPYDVRDDPWFDEMTPKTQQKFLFMQRHKNPEAWPDQIIPHAAKTSNFDFATIS